MELLLATLTAAHMQSRHMCTCHPATTPHTLPQHRTPGQTENPPRLNQNRILQHASNPIMPVWSAPTPTARQTITVEPQSPRQGAAATPTQLDNVWWLTCPMRGWQASHGPPTCRTKLLLRYLVPVIGSAHHGHSSVDRPQTHQPGEYRDSPTS